MKRFGALLLLLLTLTACGNNQTEGTQSAEGNSPAAQEVATEYSFSLTEGEAQNVENLIFEKDVTVSGDNAQITFTNCTFQGNIINTANEGTLILLPGSTLEGKCVFQNETKEATMDWSFPKILAYAPVEVSCEDCIGSVILMGDFETVFNGQTYTMEDSELFYDLSDENASFVPYEGQQASYYCVCQWWENGEQIVMVECEYDPD